MVNKIIDTRQVSNDEISIDILDILTLLRSQGPGQPLTERYVFFGKYMKTTAGEKFLKLFDPNTLSLFQPKVLEAVDYIRYTNKQCAYVDAIYKPISRSKA